MKTKKTNTKTKKTNSQGEAVVAALVPSAEPLHIRPTDIVAFIGRERWDALVKQAESLGFTGKTLLDAAIERTPREIAEAIKPGVAAIHLIRLAGSAPSKEDRAKLKALATEASPAPAAESLNPQPSTIN